MSKEAKHTPGPWARHHVLRPYQVYNTGYEQLICNVKNEDDPFSDHSDTEAIANAQLIAAAPEMLEALQTAMVLLDEAASEYAMKTGRHLPTWTAGKYNYLKEVIKKATGNE